METNAIKLLAKLARLVQLEPMMPTITEQAKVEEKIRRVETQLCKLIPAAYVLLFRKELRK